MISSARDDIMGMPITVHIVDDNAIKKDIAGVFDFFQNVDNRFSTYKKNSEISKFNRKEITERNISADMKEIFKLAKETKKETRGFFNIKKSDGIVDPSGLVKGWAIEKAADILRKKGFKNFYIEAGGDIQTVGLNADKKPWKVGIRNPLRVEEIVKVVCLSGGGIATSGTYMRGQHVYNPHNANLDLKKIVSISVIAPNIYDADRFATAVFAMQEEGIQFLELQKNLEGYMIDSDGIATYTSGFEKFVC